jgi:PST family polysaccharide transporter
MAVTPEQNPPAPAQQAALGRTVGGGMTLMFFATIISKLATTIAQGLLGWWLLPEHFNSFALATTAAGLIMLARDASIPNWLVQKGTDDFDRNVGPGFFIALVYNSGAGLLMALLAYPLGKYWANDSHVGPMLIVMAASLPLGTPGTIAQARLRSQMRFRSLTTLLTVSGILRQVFTIALAWAGYNELSLSLPVVLTAVFETVAGFIVTRDAPWSLAPQVQRWKQIFAETWPLIQGTVANFLTDWGPYVALPFFMSDASGKQQVGYYFWGYMLLGQIGAMLSNNLFVIFLPALTRLRNEPERLAQAYLRALRSLMLAACFACVGVASIIHPLEHLVWRGKWSATTDAVILLAIFFPWKATFGLTTATFMAIQRSRRYSITTWFEGLVLMIAAVYAAAFHPFARDLVIFTGVALLIGRGVAMIVLMKTLHQHSRQLARATGPAWGVSLVAGAAGVLVDHYAQIGPWVLNSIPGAFVLDEYGAGQQVMGDLFSRLGSLQAWTTTLIDVTRCFVSGGVCVLVWMALARLLLRVDLEDVIAQGPSRFRRPLRALLLLPEPVE